MIGGVLASLKLESQAFDACAGELDSTWGDFEKAITQFENKDWVSGVKSLGGAVGQISSAVSACDIPQLGNILEDTAKKLGMNGLAQDIGQVCSVGSSIISSKPRAQ